MMYFQKFAIGSTGLFTILAGTAISGGVPLDLALLPSGTSAAYYRSADGGQRGVPMIAGDFDGDGHKDVGGTPFSASVAGLTLNGELIVVFGEEAGIPQAIDTGNYTGRTLLVRGVESHALLGVESYTADFDGDGIDDIVLGSSHGVFRSTADRAGEVVILYGNSEWGRSITEIDLRNLPTGQRARFILGEREGDRLGSWFSAADIDKNGVPDLVMGMDLSDGRNGDIVDSGAVAILWDVATAHSDRTMLRVGDVETEDAFTIIHGEDTRDLFGATNWIDDFDGDGNLDLVVSAGVSRSGLFFTGSPLFYLGQGGGDGPLNDRSNAGESTIFWNAQLLKSYRRLSLAGSWPSAIERTIIYGENGNDFLGEELFGGDVNGDGIKDLMVGALIAKNPASGIATGAAYLFPGGSTLRGFEAIDLRTPPADFVTAFYGVPPNGIAGDTLEIFDINEDGFEDIFYAIVQGNSSDDRVRSGYTTVIYGKSEFPTMPANIQVSQSLSPDSMHAVILGADGGDLLAYSTTFLDMDGDGIIDYIPNAMAGDGFNNAWGNAGEYYVVNGLTISRYGAAPMNLQAATGPDDRVLTWESQPIFGGPIAYDVTFRADGGMATEVVRLFAPEARNNDFPAAGEILSLVAINRAGAANERTSIAVPVNPPVRVEPVIVTPTPTATPSPTPTPTTPTATITLTPTITPSPTAIPTTPTVTATPTPTVTPTPTATATPTTVTPTLAPIGETSFNFIGGSDGWVSANPEPFARLQFENDPVAGTLSIISSNNQNSFGYWESQPVNLEPSITRLPGITGPNSLYLATYTVSSSLADPNQAPVLRLRSSSLDFQRSDLIVATSVLDAAFSPTVEGRVYRQLFAQPEGSTAFRLHFDLLNFDGLDAADATLSIGAVEVLAFNAQQLGVGTLVAEYDLVEGNTEAWEVNPVNPVFALPATFAREDGLLIRGLEAEEGSVPPVIFGNWGVQSDVELVGGALYRLSWNISSEATAANINALPTFRLRVNDSTFRFAALTNIDTREQNPLAPIPGGESTYDVWFIAPGAVEGSLLNLSFDYLFERGPGIPEQDPTLSITLRRIDIHRFDATLAE